MNDEEINFEDNLDNQEKEMEEEHNQEMLSELESLAPEESLEIPPEPLPEPEPVPEPVEIEQEQPPAKKELSRFWKIFRRVALVLIVILGFFLVGFFYSHFVVVKPLRAEMAAVQADLDETRNQLMVVQEENERLMGFEEANQRLQEEAEDLEIHVIVLSARVTVDHALRALQDDNLADARLALDKVGSTLDDLRSRLNTDQQGVVDNMLQRLELIQDELTDDLTAAQSDLIVLASKLVALENTLFAAP